MNRPKLAQHIMLTKLQTVPPEINVLKGLRHLLKHRISGAPVIEGNQRYLGMFSEKCGMSILSRAARLATERGNDERIRRVRAADIMQTSLVTLTPDLDVFDAIGHLLKHRISGAPVLDEFGDFLGVFSEKGSMDVLIESAYSQLPTTRVGFFMDIDRGRVIHEHTDLLTIARIFLDTPYRRLVVLREEKVVGQISRRDVLACQVRLLEDVWNECSILDQPIEMQETLNLKSSVIGRRPPRISEYMDANAKTITEDTDLLTIAQLFRSLPYRRLPVVRDGYLVGQISRRDLLAEAHRLMEVSSPCEQNLLYLSSLVDRNDSSITRLTK